MTDDLKSRLLAIDHGDGDSQWPRNPDGHEAWDKIEELEAIRQSLNDEITLGKRRMQRENDELRAQLAAKDAEIERLRDQLEWYGDKALLASHEHTWDGTGISALKDDGGERAREALKGGNENG